MNPPHAVNGLTTILSKHSVSETIDRLESALKARGIMVFARIDFARDAATAGMSLRPEQLLVFGNPKGGTPLLAAQPTVGLDLPFKVLAWVDEQGQVFVGYNDPAYIVARHGLSADFAHNLAPLVPLIAQAAAA